MFTFISCNNDILLGSWESDEQFFQKFECLSDPNDDLSWVGQRYDGLVYLKDGKWQPGPDILVAFSDPDGFTNYMKVIDGKLYGAVTPFLFYDCDKRLFAFPITDYSYDSQTNELKLGSYLSCFDKSTGEPVSFNIFSETYKENGKKYNGMLFTHVAHTFDSDVTVMWFDSREAFEEWWSVLENQIPEQLKNKFD